MRIFSTAAAAALFAALCVGAAAQCPSARPATTPGFAVLAITRLEPNSRAGFQITSNPKRLIIPGLDLRQLIMAAYSLRLDQVTGGPEWMDGPRFAVDATTPRPATRGEEMTMLQQALVRRFHLVCHEETKPEKVLALTRLPGPLKFKSLDAGMKATPAGPNQLAFTSIGQLVAMLGNFASVGLLAHPVVDETGLTGGYDIHLNVGVDHGAVGGVAISRKNAVEIPHDIERQLGLKLVTRTEPVLHLIVASASAPTAN
jgi:uncharacterized protein (TIGR03435 family)